MNIVALREVDSSQSSQGSHSLLHAAQALPIPLLGIISTPSRVKSGEMSSVWLLEDCLGIDEYIRGVGMGTSTVFSVISAGLEDESMAREECPGYFVFSLI